MKLSERSRRCGGSATPRRRRRVPKKLVAKVDGDLVDALLSLVMKEETSAHQAYAAVALQRLTLEDVVAKRVAGESGKLIERVRSVEGVVQAVECISW